MTYKLKNWVVREKFELISCYFRVNVNIIENYREI